MELQHATLDSLRVNVTAYTTPVEYLHGHYVPEAWDYGAALFHVGMTIEQHRGSYTLNDEL